jgi:hypothetical protein
VLSQAGLGKPELGALTEALTHDKGKPGSKVMNWIKENAGKVLSGGVQVGTKIGQEILTAWIKAHCGI